MARRGCHPPERFSSKDFYEVKKVRSVFEVSIRDGRSLPLLLGFPFPSCQFRLSAPGAPYPML